MDVHLPHGNLPIVPMEKDAIRLYVVCYLRYNVWVKTKNKSKTFFLNQTASFQKFRLKSAPSQNKTKKMKKN